MRVLLRATPTYTGPPFFKVISERPVILSSEYRALGQEAITTYFKLLGLTQPARAGLELTTSRLLYNEITIKYIVCRTA